MLGEVRVLRIEQRHALAVQRMRQGERLAIGLGEGDGGIGLEIGFICEAEFEQQPGAERLCRGPTIRLAQLLGQAARRDGGCEAGAGLAQLQTVPGDAQQGGQTDGAVGRDLGQAARNDQRRSRLAGAAETARFGQLGVLARGRLGLGDRSSPSGPKLAGTRYRGVVALIGVVRIGLSR
jgi:hypothetical protein